MVGVEGGFDFKVFEYEEIYCIVILLDFILFLYFSVEFLEKVV